MLRTSFKWRWWGLVTLASLASANSGLAGAVRVGNHTIAEPEVARAWLSCRTESAEEGVLGCLKRAWIPRWLLDAHILDNPEIARSLETYEQNDLMHRALVLKIQNEIAEPSDGEIDAYIAKHQRDFEKPLRIRLSRILVSSKEEAEEVLSELGSPVAIESFRKIARAHSLDTATHERGGDLGFAWPNGSTDIPQVSADPALYQAALGLKDGELAKEPVPEGERFAVLWRRGSLAATSPSEESRKIAALRIREAKADAQITQVLDQHSQQISEKSAVLLGFLRRADTKLFETR